MATTMTRTPFVAVAPITWGTDRPLGEPDRVIKLNDEQGTDASLREEGTTKMGLLLAVLLIALILGGLGFAVHVLWIVAVIAFVIWLIGFFVAGSSRRWYRW